MSTWRYQHGLKHEKRMNGWKGETYTQINELESKGYGKARSIRAICFLKSLWLMIILPGVSSSSGWIVILIPAKVFLNLSLPQIFILVTCNNDSGTTGKTNFDPSSREGICAPFNVSSEL